jgi:hypothetical protein
VERVIRLDIISAQPDDENEDLKSEDPKNENMPEDEDSISEE